MAKKRKARQQTAYIASERRPREHITLSGETPHDNKRKKGSNLVPDETREGIQKVCQAEKLRGVFKETHERVILGSIPAGREEITVGEKKRAKTTRGAANFAKKENSRG